MRLHDKGGTFYRVSVSAKEVERFNSRWPCSEMRPARRRGVYFEFDRRNGDLVDCNAPRRWDGGALVALASDALAYARSKGVDHA